MIASTRWQELEEACMDVRVVEKAKKLTSISNDGGDRGTVAHRHAIMWRLGLIYTRERRGRHGKSILGTSERMKGLLK